MNIERIHAIAIAPTAPLHIPGTSLIQSLASGAVTIVLAICVLGLLISAGMMAVGHHSSNGRLADRGRTGVIASIIGAVVAGAAFALVTFAFASGGKIH